MFIQGCYREKKKLLGAGVGGGGGGCALPQHKQHKDHWYLFEASEGPSSTEARTRKQSWRPGFFQKGPECYFQADVTFSFGSLATWPPIKNSRLLVPRRMWIRSPGQWHTMSTFPWKPSPTPPPDPFTISHHTEAPSELTRWPAQLERFGLASEKRRKHLKCDVSLFLLLFLCQ